MLSFTTLHPHVQRHAAQLMEQSGHTAQSAKLLLALDPLLHSPDLYDQLCNTGSSFFIHFATTITQESIPERESFALLEDILIFIREKTLRTPLYRTMPAERHLLDWVESGILWKSTDGTLFSCMYYYDLPLCVMQGIMRQLASPLTSAAL